MKKIKIVFVGIVCLIMTSCGQMLSAISNGSVVDAITSVIGMDKVSARGLIGTCVYQREPVGKGWWRGGRSTD